LESKANTMSQEDNYLDVNKKAWNSKTHVHAASDFYNVEAFLNGKSSLNTVELELLGNVAGKKVLHLQCHFGLDTLSLARLGANVTGVDFSETAIQKAEEIRDELQFNARFICCDVYNLPNILNEQFDIVFTSYGTIGWLPDLDKWAGVISHFLKPGGRFVFAEFHPVVWMFDANFTKVAYNYFKDAAIVETETDTYAKTNAPLQNTMITWNHSLSEVMGCLLGSGITISDFIEYDYSSYNCFNGTVEYEPGRYRIAHLDNKIPMVYSVIGTKTY